MTKLFDNFKDTTEVNFFANCIEICYSRRGFGFGTLTLHYDPLKKKWKMDDECTSKEFVTQMLQDAVPLIVEQLYNRD